MSVDPRDWHLIHGTADGYQNHGCRCANCTAASTAYNAWLQPLRAARLGPCSVPGCERGQYAKGLCHAHYDRQRLTGTVNADVPIRESSVRDGELRCTTCGEWLPDVEFPHNRGANAVRRGRHGQCRPCGTEARRAYREAKGVPCEDCGTPAEGAGRPNGRTARDGTRIQLDPNRPYLCRACANRRNRVTA